MMKMLRGRPDFAAQMTWSRWISSWISFCMPVGAFEAPLCCGNHLKSLADVWVLGGFHAVNRGSNPPGDATKITGGQEQILAAFSFARSGVGLRSRNCRKKDREEIHANAEGLPPVEKLWRAGL
jgi:hypothetical protein